LIASKLPIEVASLVRLWAVTLQALVDGQGNRSAAALAVLENEPIRIRFPLFWNALYSTAFCRYLRAEQLNRLGRYEEALKWYGALAETYFFDLPYRAPAALKRAGIYETLNQPEKAIREYERFLYIWRDCGPEFQHITAEAENRVKALKRKE
jgi:tetratricopeptide (TPR) repeat protein